MPKIKNHWKKIVFFVVFSLLFFVPRYFAHLQYDAMEDEILAIDFNLNLSFKELLSAPDYSHPPLWYVLMIVPTKMLGISHGIIYYRVVQVLILFFMLCFSLLCFGKKLPNKFFFYFFSLFFSNIYLVHLTFQHRMYAMVIGVAIFYSFYWYHVIKNKQDIFFKHFFFLGLTAALGFFTNYSMIWLIPVWPLAYFLYKRNLHAIKRILVFSLSFLTPISWFLPYFFRNSLENVTLNQFAPQVNLENTFHLLGNYFGLMRNFDFKINLAPVLFLIVFMFLITVEAFKRNKSYFYTLPASLFFMFFLFFFLSYQTGNSFFYARTSITFTIFAYVIISDIFTQKRKNLKPIAFFMIFLQVIYFFIYFSRNEKLFKYYDHFNYQVNPIGYFTNINFKKSDCLIPIPDWNYLLANYFLGDKVRVVSTHGNDRDGLFRSIETCSSVYILDQISVDRNRVQIKGAYELIFSTGKDIEQIEERENQILYKLVL